MLSSKPPVCKYCGGNHPSFSCWSKPKKSMKQSLFSTPSKPLQARKNKKLNTLPSKTRNTRKQLVKQLDEVISKYVRRSNADQLGFVRCYTCKKRVRWQDSDCSHYISRTKWPTRFDLDNLRPCCQYCNRTLHGNLKVFRRELVSELGEERVDALELKRFQSKKYTELELLSMIYVYETKSIKSLT